MELLIVIAVGVIVILNLIGMMIFHEYMRMAKEEVINGMINKINSLELLFLTHLSMEHKKTRKETQELKTRLTQVRKDLNKIEKGVFL